MPKNIDWSASRSLDPRARREFEIQRTSLLTSESLLEAMQDDEITVDHLAHLVGSERGGVKQLLSDPRDMTLSDLVRFAHALGRSVVVCLEDAAS